MNGVKLGPVDIDHGERGIIRQTLSGREFETMRIGDAVGIGCPYQFGIILEPGESREYGGIRWTWTGSHLRVEEA